MKTFLTITLFNLIPLGLYGQVCLKGICLGEKGEDRELIPETVAEVEGTIVTFTTKNGQIYMILFVPGNGRDTQRVYDVSLLRVLDGLTAKFGVQFEFRQKGSDSFDGIYKATLIQGGRKYAIMVEAEKNENLVPPVELSASIIDLALFEIWNAEDQQKATSDF